MYQMPEETARSILAERLRAAEKQRRVRAVSGADRRRHAERTIELTRLTRG
jgi:hypothetical protein